MSKIDKLKLRKLEVSSNSQPTLNSYNSESSYGSSSYLGSIWGSYDLTGSFFETLGSIGSALGSKFGSIGSSIGSSIESWGSSIGSAIGSFIDDYKDECSTSGDCPSGYVCDSVKDIVYPFYTRKKCRLSSPKESACNGKSTGDPCSFSYNGAPEYGRCVIIGDSPMHCSDFKA